MATLTMYLRAGAWAGNAWGGGVTFTRDDVAIEELLTDLRACVSDDGALSDHLGDVHAIRSMHASVHVPGDLHTVKERMSRFSRITHVHEGEVGEFVVLVLVVGLALLFPIYAIVIATAIAGGVYALLRIGRSTFLFAYPALFVLPLIFAAGMFREEFEWAGRRYRLYDVNDIEMSNT